MRLLIIGGSVFLGRYLVAEAEAAGHQITLFNRGEHNPDLFPNIEKVRGDRKVDLSGLRGRTWDAVIDTCGYFPRDVRASATTLSAAVNSYTFISTMSVYADLATVSGLDERGAIATSQDVDATEITGENYGPLKALCEAEVEKALPNRSLIIRPGLIVGPHDPSDRFTYWPVRVARGGDVLAPDSPSDPVQFIDVRDLAQWTLEMTEKRATGVFNATGPAHELTMGEVLQASKEASDSDARFVWASAEWLVNHGVKPWTEMPLWVPGAPGYSHSNVGKAVSAGLSFRRLEDTIRATLQWAQTRPADHEWRGGLGPERERELLALLEAGDG